MAPIVDRILALGTFQVVALPLLIVVSVWAAILYVTRIRYPANLPLIREKEGATRFSLKTRLAYYTDCQNLLIEAYEKVSLLSMYISVKSSS
jgi:hypothetical protein